MRYLLLFILFSFSINAQIFISPDGNDILGDGSLDKPIRSFKKAFELVKTMGDTIYLRGGIYDESQSIEPTVSGDSAYYKCLFAYNGELPIIDFSQQTYSSSSRGIKLTKNYWYLKGLEIKNAGDNGIHISGHYNKVVNCSLHHNKDTGLQISNGGSNNHIINCDSYLNYDPNTHGENADGFAPKLDIGPGNYFKNCRAWNNSDDGWDTYEGQNPMIIDSCWAFQNGINIWNDPLFQGDGNGFKLGGNDVPAPHIVRNSIAFDNPGNGFDQNNNTAGLTLFNCTAFRNGRNYRLNEDPIDTSFSQHNLKNNISFDGSITIAASSIDSNNSWNGFFPTWQDFESLDTSLAKIPRDQNFKIPYTNFLKLKSSSQFVDAGIDVGIDYFGKAPDIGAFEFNPNLTGMKSVAMMSNDFSLYQNYPNPFNPTTTINYSIAKKSLVKIDVFDLTGRKLKSLINEIKNAGNYQVIFSAGEFASGVYIYRLQIDEKYQIKKMILVK